MLAVPTILYPSLHEKVAKVVLPTPDMLTFPFRGLLIVGHWTVKCNVFYQMNVYIYGHTHGLFLSTNTYFIIWRIFIVKIKCLDNTENLYCNYTNTKCLRARPGSIWSYTYRMSVQSSTRNHLPYKQALCFQSEQSPLHTHILPMSQFRLKKYPRLH